MRLPRYRFGARVYDLLSLERPLYRAGRMDLIRLARPRPGDRVLDVGCGTGLNFEPLLGCLGGTGRIVALDASPSMLRQARYRVRRHGWTSVEIVRADAVDLAARVDGPFDVIVFAYSLGVVGDWHDVWAQALSLLAPGGRIGVVDTRPFCGPLRVLNPLVRALLWAGDVHPDRRVWQLVARDTDGVETCTVRGGHVVLSVGHRRADA